MTFSDAFFQKCHFPQIFLPHESFYPFRISRFSVLSLMISLPQVISKDLSGPSTWRSLNCLNCRRNIPGHPLLSIQQPSQSHLRYQELSKHSMFNSSTDQSKSKPSFSPLSFQGQFFQPGRYAACIWFYLSSSLMQGEKSRPFKRQIFSS